MPPRVTYQLRIALKGTKPPIWRRILVSPSMKLDRLHDVIQAVMGWQDCHLHMFIKGRQCYSIPSPWDDDWRAPGTPRDLHERKYRVSQLLKRDKDWITYEYDFGDSWEHRVTLQKILPTTRPSVCRRALAASGDVRRKTPEGSGATMKTWTS